MTAQRQVEGFTPLRAETVLTADSDARRSLEGVNPFGIVDRCTCYVKETEEVYRWFEDSTLAPSPPAIIAPASITPPDPGRWIMGGGSAASGLVIVTSQADFPAPVAGVITLAANTCYLIEGTVTIDADVQIAFSAGSVLLGIDPACAVLSGNTTSPTPFILAASGTALTVSGVRLVNTGTGAVVSYGGGGAVMELTNAKVDGNSNGPGIIIGTTAFARLTNTDVTDYTGTGVDILGTGSVFWHGGFILRGAAGSTAVAIRDSSFVQLENVNADVLDNCILVDAAAVGAVLFLLDTFLGGTGTVLDIQGTVSFFQCVGSAITVVGGATGIDLAGANVAFARVVGTSFINTGGTTFSGFATPPEATTFWEFQGCIGVDNSASVGGLHSTAGGSLATPGGLMSSVAALAPALDAATTRFGLSGNQMFYGGQTVIRCNVRAMITASLGVAAAAITAQIEKNAVAVNTAVSVVAGQTPDTRTIIVEATVDLANGDDIDVRIAGIPGGDALAIASYTLNAVASAA